MTTTEIPIWVSGKRLWVTGVDKKTTVNDVIETLLGHADKEYSLVEKWCHVERPLNGDTRLLKLWKAWGDTWKDVKLSLRKVVVENDSGRSSPSSYSSRRRHHHHNRHASSSSSCKYGQTIHPRRLSQLSKTQNIEKLLKLILLQGETIQSQISRLKDKDNQIEYFESEQHRGRIKSLGCNYLLETYLGGGANEADEKEDSGVVTECTPSSEYNSTPEITIDEDFETEMKELRDKIHMLEKIVKVNKKIEKEEENLVRLYINIERCRKNDKLITDLTLSLEQLKNECEQGETEFNNNSSLLTDMESILASSKCYLSKLQNELINDGELNSIQFTKQNDQLPLNLESTEQQCYSIPNGPTKQILDTLV